MQRAILVFAAIPLASAPALAACPAATTGPKSSGQFAALNGVIYGPDQQPWVARGVNLMEGDMGKADQVPALFPGVNFVRLPVYTYASPSQLQSVVNTLTSKGIVVELEDHTTSTGGNAGGSQGTVFSGQQLQNELSWYSSVASAFKGNPYVWFGTNNEPPEAGGSLSEWHQQTYQAIRSTGNNSPVMIDPWGAYSTQGLDPSAYRSMNNIIVDDHFYGWGANYSTDQSAVNAALAKEVSDAKEMFNGAPVIVGEFGDGTDGYNVDQNWQQVVQAVQSAAQSGQTSGSAAWAFSGAMPANDLLNGGGLSSYGQMIANGIQALAGGCPALPGATTTALANDLALSSASASAPAFTVAAPSYGSANDTTSSDQIEPASGGITDAIGNQWSISASGSIQENGRWVAGGGGTAALQIVDGVVYGLDAHGRGWFILSGDGSYWTPSQPPPGASTVHIAASNVPGTGGQAPASGGSLVAPASSLSDVAPESGFVSWYPPGDTSGSRAANGGNP